jgi:hypothetical protein
MSDIEEGEDYSRSSPCIDYDSFELNEKSWNPDSIYEDIATMRRTSRTLRPITKSISPTKNETGASSDEQSQTKFLNLPKGGWGAVQQVTTVTSSQFEFPTLVEASISKSDKPSSVPFTQPSGPTKWKKITEEFFRTNEDEQEFVPIHENRKNMKLTPSRRLITPSSQLQCGHPHPPQGHSPRGHPQQGHSPRGHPQQGHPQQGHSPRGQEKQQGNGTFKTKNNPSQSMQEPKAASEEFKFTRMCNFANSCKRTNCSFAHTLDQFTPVECRFQDKCKTKDTCRFRHSSETKEAFLARTS